ncbi:MAG TPA: SRPBCC domain-containing protein [Kofleriaceae bacterium]|jgi:uncharacterized protein YndB with AHSA1/START domain
MATTVLVPGDTPTIVMERVFKAPRQLVWNAFTQVEHITKWWGGPGCVNDVTLDFRVGGKWTHKMKLPNGVEFTMDWVFTEIDPPNRLGWGGDGECGKEKDSASMLATFSDVPGGTKWKLLSTFTDAAQRDYAVSKGFARPIEVSNEELERYLATLL